ncbi:MAG: glycosyltransferase family 2 protein [Muribaculaceae bacterium]|nr:glycosyltransferase family 2 protein [Muribaculaceae bacterium]
MLVSIVIPFYRSEAYIEQCIRSLFSQTYDEVEFIFVDDGGDDGSVAILKGLIEEYPDKKIKFIANDTNRGSAYSRQRGVDAATGEYVIQVDSDDFVHPEYVSRLAERAAETDADVVVCKFARFFSDEEVVSPDVEGEGNHVSTPSQALNDVISGRMHASLCNKLVRRSILEDNDIRFIEGLNMLDDKSVIFRVFYFAKSVSSVDETLYYYRKTNPQSISLSGVYKQLGSAIKCLQLVLDFFAEKKADDALREAINDFKIGVLGLALLYGDDEHISQTRAFAPKLSWRGIRKHPTLRSYYKFLLWCEMCHMPWLASLARRVLLRIKKKLR